jgi:Secretion system C-terminal sorting domain
MLLYPQPSDKYIIISKANKTTTLDVDNVSIYDQKGSVLFLNKNYLLGSKIDVSILPSGAYNVSIKSGNDVEVKPFIKL